MAAVKSSPVQVVVMQVVTAPTKAVSAQRQELSVSSQEVVVSEPAMQVCAQAKLEHFRQ